MSVTELELERDKKKYDVATILNNHLLQTCQEKLKKRMLAKKLADIIVSDIVSKKQGHKQTFENEIDEIMNYIVLESSHIRT